MNSGPPPEGDDAWKLSEQGFNRLGGSKFNKRDLDRDIAEAALRALMVKLAQGAEKDRVSNAVTRARDAEVARILLIEGVETYSEAAKRLHLTGEGKQKVAESFARIHYRFLGEYDELNRQRTVAKTASPSAPAERVSGSKLKASSRGTALLRMGTAALLGLPPGAPVVPKGVFGSCLCDGATSRKSRGSGGDHGLLLPR